MITSLSIENFALINSLHVDFNNGFSTITGETGAGKSIILGALSLVLGKRADLTSVKNKEIKCVIEANFDIKKYNLQNIFNQYDFDYDDITVIRREILPTGKSRAFVNDSPVNLQDLQELGNFLIDIHSQNQTLQLAETSFQFKIIDTVANNFDVIESYTSLLKEYKKNIQLLENKQLEFANAQKEQDYNLFLFNELNNANLIANEQEELESNLEKLNNVEFLTESFKKITVLASDEQFGVNNTLKEIKTILSKIGSLSKQYENLFERLSSIIIEFNDIEKEVEKEAEQLFFSPDELEKINQKLQLVYSLQKKHQVNSVEDLIKIKAELENKVIALENFEADINNLNQIIENSKNELDKIAAKIHETRKKAISNLTIDILQILQQLGMPNSNIKIELKEINDYFQNGKDEINFLFSANKGLEYGPLKKVASGGEMSRIMLAVKSILAKHSNLPTIIFDEIDTGVSGEIANKMGEIMKSMSQNMQVFAITHLPQIAAKGTAHYKVFKTEEETTTTSQLILLSNQERELEIAEMLSGKNISDSALIHAKNLLN